jgi:FPC/CPF motif-containing protein YcgG
LCENITLLEFATTPSPARVKVVSWMKGAKGKQRENTAIARKFRAFIGRCVYPCLGAKAALNTGTYELECYAELGHERASAHLASDLHRFIDSPLRQRSDFATFAAIFRGPIEMTELEFEQRLWQTLQQLNRIDGEKFDWDPTVGREPERANFAFSFGGHAFYIVGMHRRSSRLARRFPLPALMFNAHEQFRKLRLEGKWERMKASIRKRDAAWQGECNPMLDDFGERSEARQYSGRAVEESWRPSFWAAQMGQAGRCPFPH